MAWFVSRRNCQSFLTANTVAGPLGRAHRSGGATGNHQDPPATLLLPGWTHHPQGPPPHPASAPRLALGNPVQWRPGSIACLAAPFLMVAPATGPPPWPSSASQSVKRLPSSRQMAHRVFPAASGSSIKGSSRLTLGGRLPTTRPIYPHSAPTIASSSPSCSVPVFRQCLSVDSGGGVDHPLTSVTAAAAPRSAAISSSCSSAARRSSMISSAIWSGGGRLSESSRLSSRSQKMSRMVASVGCSWSGVGFVLPKPLSPNTGALSYPFTTPTDSPLRWIGG